MIDALLGCGLSEAATTAFADEALPERLLLPAGDPRADAVRVANPMGADQARLRTLLFPGLLDAAARNLDAGRSRVGLFEVARVVLPRPPRCPTSRFGWPACWRARRLGARPEGQWSRR